MEKEVITTLIIHNVSRISRDIYSFNIMLLEAHKKYKINIDDKI